MTRGSTPVVVLEFFAAGGRLGDRRAAAASAEDAALAAEGRALLRALVEDLAALPGVTPVAVADGPTAAVLPADVEVARADGSPARAAVRAALDRPGAWLWPVAPETRGRLARACRAAEEAGVPLVGTPSDGVRRAARRRRLLRRLDRSGLATPATVRAPTPAHAGRGARELGWPVVVKPGRGAGGAGTTRVEAPAGVEAAWSRAAAAEPGVSPMVQAYVPGVAASAVLLCGPRGRARPLAFSRQRVRFEPTARYEGGRTPFRHPLARASLRVAGRTARAVGGLRGLVGVDVVLTPTAPAVMEVNPRLTTSYLGLRRHAGPAAAAAALRASGLPLPGPAPARETLPLGLGSGPDEPVSFRPGAGG